VGMHNRCQQRYISGVGGMVDSGGDWFVSVVCILQSYSCIHGSTWDHSSTYVTCDLLTEGYSSTRTSQDNTIRLQDHTIRSHDSYS
jgi:hypothetical protein